MILSPFTWKNKSVLITGHTGFKGGWLSLWLKKKGALVHGLAMAPKTNPSFFETCAIEACVDSSAIGDLVEPDFVHQVLQDTQPEVVFHLAAQPLVRESYANPIETFNTNVMGTVRLLEAARKSPSTKTIIVITTDKCYENHEWPWGYRETDPLGGHDPYSASKAAAEIATSAYRDSFLANSGISVATARAGNVIGGGDFSNDRLLPDFFRALDAKKPLVIRAPQATRPWQHVLEPLNGYLMLAERMGSGTLPPNNRASNAWNFGPSDASTRTVGWVVSYLASKLPEAQWQVVDTGQPHEATMLRLDSGKANQALAWHTYLPLTEALDSTIMWHQAWRSGEAMQAVSLQQIHDFETRISKAVAAEVR